MTGGGEGGDEGEAEAAGGPGDEHLAAFPGAHGYSRSTAAPALIPAAVPSSMT